MPGSVAAEGGTLRKSKSFHFFAAPDPKPGVFHLPYGKTIKEVSSPEISIRRRATRKIQSMVIGKSECPCQKRQKNASGHNRRGIQGANP